MGTINLNVFNKTANNIINCYCIGIVKNNKRPSIFTKFNDKENQDKIFRNIQRYLKNNDITINEVYKR